jgi:hypothetical protein
MDEKPIPTRALSPQDRLLRGKLAEDVAGQSGRMDELARQLITLELAVPGLYATALKLVAGEKASVTPDVWLYLAFASWGLALALALFGLFPRKYPVDPGRLFADDEHADGPFSIEARPIDLAQALDALKGLAEQLGLPGGLDGWEALARQIVGYLIQALAVHR